MSYTKLKQLETVMLSLKDSGNFKMVQNVPWLRTTWICGGKGWEERGEEGRGGGRRRVTNLQLVYWTTENCFL